MLQFYIVSDFHFQYKCTPDIVYILYYTTLSMTRAFYLVDKISEDVSFRAVVLLMWMKWAHSSSRECAALSKHCFESSCLLAMLASGRGF